MAGVMKTEKDERSQAKDIKMLSLMGAAAAKINEQTDKKVSRPYKVLINAGTIDGDFPHHHVINVEIDAVARNRINGFFPSTHPDQRLGDFDGFADRQAIDQFQLVARAQSGLRSFTGGRNRKRHDTIVAINPDHAIFGEVEPLELLEIDESRHTHGQREDGQDCRRQLELKFLQHAAAALWLSSETTYRSTPQHVWGRGFRSFL